MSFQEYLSIFFLDPVLWLCSCHGFYIRWLLCLSCFYQGIFVSLFSGEGKFLPYYWTPNPWLTSSINHCIYPHSPWVVRPMINVTPTSPVAFNCVRKPVACIPEEKKIRSVFSNPNSFVACTKQHVLEKGTSQILISHYIFNVAWLFYFPTLGGISVPSRHTIGFSNIFRV
jgi:hypothetical protein